MNQNKISTYLFRPFEKIAGWQAFFTGLIIVAVTGFTSKYAGVFFDGVIDTHFTNDVTFTKSFTVLSIDIVSISVVMWLAGFFLSKNFRFIDILGTMTLARAPLLIIAIASLFVNFPAAEEVLKSPGIIITNIQFLILMILSLPVIIWVIALTYNAFIISTNGKGTKATFIFITAIIISEILSKILIHYIL